MGIARKREQPGQKNRQEKQSSARTEESPGKAKRQGKCEAPGKREGKTRAPWVNKRSLGLGQ